MTCVIGPSDIIYHFYADGFELYASCGQTSNNSSICISDAKVWITENKLNLNPAMTRQDNGAWKATAGSVWMLFILVVVKLRYAQVWRVLDLPVVLCCPQNATSALHNKACYYQICQICIIIRTKRESVYDFKSASAQVWCFVLTETDCWNAFCLVHTQKLSASVQKAQNCNARLVLYWFNAKRHHMTRARKMNTRRLVTSSEKEKEICTKLTPSLQKYSLSHTSIKVSNIFTRHVIQLFSVCICI